jgi:hypothetical protein
MARANHGDAHENNPSLASGRCQIASHLFWHFLHANRNPLQLENAVLMVNAKPEFFSRL